jgi:N-acetylglucosamine-6-phosphate deacetylase
LAGARCFTHLFNAMSPMQGRDPGVTGTAILSSSYVGIICDGIHVADDMVALALRARPEPNLTFLVSDAMPTVGGPSQFDLYGQSIKLDQGRLINAEGSLAGAHTTLAAGIRRLVSNLNIPVQTALKMAISVPCAVMGLDLDRLQGQKIEALLHLNAQGSYTGPVSQISPPQKPR